MTGDLRSGLAALAGEAPIELRRSEQVWVRYRRHRRRKVGLAVGATLAAVALASLVVPNRDVSGLVTHNPTPTPSSAPPESPPPRGAQPPSGGPSVPATAPASRAHFASPSGSTPPPAAAGWPAGVVAWASPTHAHRDEYVTVNVYPYAGDNGVDGYTIDWGDGSTPFTRDVRICQPTLKDGRHPLQGPTLLSSHKYLTDGTYTATVTMRLDGCGRPPQIRTATTTVHVEGAAPIAFGPEGLSGTSIKVDRADPAEPAPRKVAVSISELNADRYAEFVFVSWGDGTVDVLRDEVPSWCATAPPAPDPGFPMHVEHTYARAGHYDVGVYVQTATCEGGRGQGGSNGRSFDV